MRTARTPIRWAIVGTAMTALTACKPQPGTSDSGPNGMPIHIDSLYLHAAVERDDDRVQVIAALYLNPVPFDRRAPRGNDYEINGGDQLRACNQNDCAMLTPVRNSSFGAPSYYSANLPFRADDPYTITFIRGATELADDTTVTMPEAFTLAEPLADQVFTDGQSIRVSGWTVTPESDIEIYSNVYCTFSNADPLFRSSVKTDTDRSGFMTLNVDDLIAFAKLPPGFSTTRPLTECRISLEVSDVRTGSVDPLYRGGDIVGVLSRWVTVTYRPTT